MIDPFQWLRNEATMEIYRLIKFCKIEYDALHNASERVPLMFRRLITHPLPIVL